MNPIVKNICVISGCALLISCGGNENSAAGDPAAGDPAAGAAAAQSTAAAPKPRASNPLASQQQLIRDAAGIQAILDKDAQEKKNAVKNID